MSDLRSKSSTGTPGSTADVYESIGDRVACLDASGTLMHCNAAYAAAVGKAAHELIGRSLAELDELAPKLLIHRQVGLSRGGRCRASAIEFDEHLARWTITRVLPTGDGLLAISEDADPELVRQHQIARQVTQDEQTGLPNLMALREELAHVAPPYELLAIEVDHVARIAEAVGQEAATLMMLGIGDNIDSVLRADERLFRTRPTEFVVLRSAPQPDAATRLHSLIEAVRRPILAFSHSFKPQATIGALAVCADRPVEPAVALRQLELAGVAARKARDGQPVWFKPAMEASVRLNEILAGELKYGIETGQLLPHFQPIHCIRSGAVMGVEALIRWMHPKLGVIEADDVMRLARGRGLAARIDLLALDASIQAISAWRRQGISLSVSVNFTSETLGDPFLPEKIAARCQAADIDPAFVEVEVPETFLLAEEGSKHTRLRALHQLGVRLSIDDFGSGAATTATLVGAPIDSVKINWQATCRMADDPDRRARAFRTLARMAQTLGFSVVAKGIETAEEENLVRTQKIALVQGFRYGMPVAMGEVPALVRTRGTPPRTISAFSI
jgi:EAL domain-containing protein (putative c-di-GMP-specific phosphodiesterase class I)/GGDEF domain-containing protein